MSQRLSWIGLGANLGDRAATLAAALHMLNESGAVQVRKVSRSYETPPWGVTDQPDFLNAVACLISDLAAHELLALLLDIEQRLGRTRDAERWGPRIIDLDLLVHGDEVIIENDLVVPHPRLAQRAFVLVPLHAIASELEIPGLGRVDELLAELDDTQVRAVRPAALLPFQND